MKELEKVNKTLEEIEDVKIYINQAYMKIDLLEKQVEIYARISLDNKEQIINFDEDVYALARRWNTTMNVIQSSISHHFKGWERIVIPNENYKG